MAYGLVMTVVLVAVSQAGGASVPRVAAATADQQDDEARDEGVRGGPPAWARRNGNDHGANKAWKEAWQMLSPSEKDKKMAALVEAHQQGMKTWTDCVAPSRNDASKRGKCVKPLPPGLAKKLP